MSESAMRPERRYVLLTGASGVVGEALLPALLDAGYGVIATAQSPAGIARLEAGQAEAIAAGAVVTVPASLNSKAGVAALLREIETLALPVYGLINNARSRATLAVDESGRPEWSDWLEEYALDVVAPAHLAFGLADMPATALRRVVNIGSVYGAVAANRALAGDDASATDWRRLAPLHYSAAKAALAQATRDLAVRLAARGITVNCVAFGGIAGRAGEDFQRRYAALSPQGRMLQAVDVPGAILFLLGAGAGAMLGQTLLVDGGWTVW